ncbi:hypothetical protein [endosymbiont GvMRE of Glomus versiforme]|uniref:hypothetical protein n=1 Tax=endosymbiont GvMRE of Glomus versiforme TaxID=2039283 RepID=UPI000ED5FC17|nr:hypothetical protein [endosymbiont GvMRE of Glomus versiforme]RHZ35949.1 hypothetical protein GvMRE_Ic4g42 [endosymbiont GvMRE of Glomus versiforme]
MEITQSIKLTPPVKFNRHGKHKNLNYYREYYQKNRERLLTYSHNYYGVKKLLKNCLKLGNKETKIGVKKISLTDTCKYNIAPSNYKSLGFFQRLGGDRKGVRLATRGKKPQYPAGSNWPTIEEHRGIEELVKGYGEHGERTGTKRGRLYFQVWDIDIRHKSQSLPSWLQKQVEKSFKLLAKIYRFSYIETQQGYQVYLLLEELSPNCEIYHRDSWRGIKRNIGSILSKGRQVQGASSQFKQFINNGSWFWKLKNIEELAAILKKFFFEIDLNKQKSNQNANLKSDETKGARIITSQNTYKILKLENILITNKQLTKKANHYRVNYLDKWQNKGFFFLDSYFRDKKDLIQPNLITNLVLAQGYKYQFFISL